MKILGVTSPYTGSGKTLATLALASKLEGSITFKIGPDYIDGEIHRAVTGSRAITIDRWLQGRKYLKVPSIYAGRYKYGIVEGVMGMYDSGSPINLSTKYYFDRLSIPYILVVEVSRMAESAYHISRGFIGKNCLGVIINNYYSPGHLEIVKGEFERHGIAVIGAITHSDSLMMPERQLGISTEINDEAIRRIAEEASGSLNLEFVSRLPELPRAPEERVTGGDPRKRIYVALDKAFNFYYESSLNALSGIGKVHYFSPMNDEVPEDPSMIYIGGGYPELYAQELSNSRRTASFIRDAHDDGVPIIAECGGMMYLESSIETDRGEFQMAGIFTGRVRKNAALTMGYTKLAAVKDSVLFRKGETAYGHEFHYSSVEDRGEKTLKNLVGRGLGGYDGLQRGNTFASYSHFDLGRYSRRLRRLII